MRTVQLQAARLCTKHVDLRVRHGARARLCWLMSMVEPYEPLNASISQWPTLSVSTSISVYM